MLKVNEGRIAFDGAKITLMAELTSLINRLVETGVVDKDDMKLIVKMAFMSEDELANTVKDIPDFIQKIAESLV